MSPAEQVQLQRQAENLTAFLYPVIPDHHLCLMEGHILKEHAERAEATL